MPILLPRPESPYKSPSFLQLAAADAEFSHHVTYSSDGRFHLDFSDRAACLALTRATLRRDFVLEVSIPQDHLCPGVSGRVQYVDWILRLVEATRPIQWPEDQKEMDGHQFSQIPEERTGEMVGLDIGGGAIPIYSLLVHRRNPFCRMLVTEIDDVSVACATSNIEANDLQDKIKVHHVQPNDPFFQVFEIHLSADPISFTMCNPPFYSSTEEYLASAAAKSYSPASGGLIPTPGGGASPNEMVCEGGEVAFVSRMVDESALPHNRTRCRWFTSLLGKLSSVGIIVARIRETGCLNWAISEVVNQSSQGGVTRPQKSRTKRWLVGWSFFPQRPPAELSRGISCGTALDRRLLPSSPRAVISMDGTDLSATKSCLQNALAGISGPGWRFGAQSEYYWCACTEDVWSRAARRRASRVLSSLSSSADKSERDQIVKLAIVFRFEGLSDSINLSVEWRQGFDSQLYESLCGVLKQRLGR